MATVIKKGTSKSEAIKIIRKTAGKPQTKELLKLAGKLKADIDPIDYQQNLRDEWKLGLR